MTVYGDTLGLLQELRESFGESILDEDAPWDGTLNEWIKHFSCKLAEEDELIERGALHWVRQKFGAAKAAAHRAFVKMVRKDPAAHRRKMRQDKRYHKIHKWHDAIMHRTARAGWARHHMGERDPGQSFMDLPFELRVTETGKGTGNWSCPECAYKGKPKPSRACPHCSAKMVAEGARDSGAELTDKGRAKAAGAASAKAGMKVPQHYLKSCSMESFYKNVHYFYRVKGEEWTGSKQEKVQRAIAASYSSLKSACGVSSKEQMTPSEIVRAGGGKLGPRGPRS
jgi:hypothetical protein